MAETGDASRLPAYLDVVASNVRSKLDFHKNAYNEYVGINDALHCVIEERKKLQQQQNAVLQIVATKDELTKKNEEQAAEIEALKKKLQASESGGTQEPQGTGFQQCQSGRVQTRSMPKGKCQFKGQGEDADEHELMVDMSGKKNPEQGLITELEDPRKEIFDIHSKLIKGFTDISSAGGRNIAIKYVGQLCDRPFLQACLEKLPRKEAQAKASELYYFWQEQLLKPEWNPFKTVTVGGIPKEIIDDHDDKLEELQAAWGEEVYKAVVNCLMEMKECGRLSNRTTEPELWNFKGKRKATLSESVEYMCSQVKHLSDTKSRTRRRTLTGNSGSG